MPPKAFAGQRFGKLLILSVLPAPPGKHGRHCFCRCECGNEKLIQAHRITSRVTRSCGCLTIKHHHTSKGIRSPTYRSWDSMISRCYNPRNAAFKYYGGRGIAVCDRWRLGEKEKNGFECFLIDMGERHGLHASLDRIDNDLGYFPSNVRWADRKAQSRNRRNNVKYEYQGEMLTLRAIAERSGVPYERLRHRLRRAGWSLTEALSTSESIQGVRRRDRSARLPKS